MDRVVRDESCRAMQLVVKILDFTVNGWKPLKVCEQRSDTM